jgi:hypothetical protein
VGSRVILKGNIENYNDEVVLGEVTLGSGKTVDINGTDNGVDIIVVGNRGG